MTLLFVSTASNYISRQRLRAFAIPSSIITRAGRHAGTRPWVVTTTTTTNRFMSNPPQKMPYDDSKMPFYAFGTNIANQVGGRGSFQTLLKGEDELDIVLKGFCDTIKGTNPTDPLAVLTQYGPKLNEILRERNSGIVDGIRKEGKEFIANFLDSNNGAIKTKSGLVYFEMTKGEGEQPTSESTVEVHYHGTLTDGTVFDSSVERGQTISFPLGGVIKGWQEGLQLMKEGGKATLVIPEDLAYGEAGSGDVIPPGATLKFEVELIKVNQ